MIITVVQGDTLFSISERYGIPQEKISADNGLPSDGVLVVGQSLILLEAQSTLDVSEPKNVSSVSLQTGISERTLYRNNIFLEGQPEIPSGSNIVLSYVNEPTLSKFMGGYAYDFIDQRLLDTTVNYMTYLMPFTYGFTPDGTLISPDDQRLIETARRMGASPLMHLSTLTEQGNFSNELANALLSNPTARENLVQNSLQNIADKGYDGIDIDFEFLFPQDRQPYVDFIARMRQVMNENGYICIVAVPPKTSDGQTGLLYEGVDYAGLGEAADYVLCMTYEWGI